MEKVYLFYQVPERVRGLRELFKDADGWRKHKLPLLISFGVCAFICILTAIFPGIFGHFSAEEHEALVASGQIQQYPSVDAAIAAVLEAQGDDGEGNGEGNGEG